jgi:Flp pilus assembly protein TadG
VGRFGTRGVQDESGMVLVMCAMVLIVLFAATAITFDIGRAYMVDRQLQAGVDAGALAGAQHLPNPADAQTVAQQYGPSPGMRNEITLEDNATTTTAAKCVNSAPGCDPMNGIYNAVQVQARSRVRTTFARVLGIDYIDVDAVATACSPCSAKPLDIMVVLDRTGSMCQTNGVPDASCTDLRNARDGIKTFLSFMDPAIDHVGLALFPPVLDQSWITTCPYTPWNGNPSGPQPDGKYYGYDAWWPWWGGSLLGTPSRYVVAPIENNYLVQDLSGKWVLNPASTLVQRLDCARGAGSTSYALSIEEAQKHLDDSGRGSVQDVIVFLSDGAANTSPMKLGTVNGSGHWTNNPTNQQRPCGTGVQSAQRVKDRGTVVYTIGYDLTGGTASVERCGRPSSNGHQNGNPPPAEACGSWGCNARDALKAMATDPTNYYEKPTPGDLRAIFTRIAADLQRPAARLVDESLAS